MASKSAKKLLTDELRKLGDEIIDVDDEGQGQTRSQKLAKLFWQYALGWTEKTRDDKGKQTEIEHKPAPWAAQYIVERLEGKVPQALVEEAGRIRAADHVRELAKNRVASLAKKAVTP